MLGVTEGLSEGKALGSILGDSLGLLIEQDENSAVTVGAPQVSHKSNEETMFPSASISCKMELER